MLKRVLAVLVVVVAALTGVSSAAHARTQVFTVHLAPAPPPTGDPDGSGVAVLRFDSDADVVCYTIVVRNIGAPTEPVEGVGSAHIHGLPGGGIAIDLHTDFMAAGANTHVARDCVSANSATIDAVLAKPRDYYVNVHTASSPTGAVQGSLG